MAHIDRVLHGTRPTEHLQWTLDHIEIWTRVNRVLNYDRAFIIATSSNHLHGPYLNIGDLLQQRLVAVIVCRKHARRTKVHLHKVVNLHR